MVRRSARPIGKQFRLMVARPKCLVCNAWVPVEFRFRCALGLRMMLGATLAPVEQAWLAAAPWLLDRFFLWRRMVVPGSGL